MECKFLSSKTGMICGPIKVTTKLIHLPISSHTSLQEMLFCSYIYKIYMHYKYQTKKTEEILYLKGMQIGVILLGLEMGTSFSY